jgi:hypothetical protein
MSPNAKTASERACRVLLRPIASMLLKCGMTWKEFSDLSKASFVEAASDEYGLDGRPTNVSRVSILTGISRKEVKRQRDMLLQEAPVGRGKTTDATRVLSGWHQDPLYTDEDSKPKLIPENGPAPSFNSLCQRYGGDIATQTMLKELLKTQAVRRDDAGNLVATSRFYRPAVHDDENLRWAVSLTRDLVETMNNNVFLDDTRVARFGRKADNERIPKSAIPEFRQYLADRGQAFLEEVDDWLTEHATSDKTEASEFVRIGVGMFAIEDANSEETSR